MKKIKNTDDWEWFWKLVIKMSRDQGLPVDSKYWERLENKIMTKIQHRDLKLIPERKPKKFESVKLI